MSDAALGLDWRLRERRSQRRKSGWQTSGGVVVDVASGRLLLVRSRRELKEGKSGWTWPKGLIDSGEGPIYAAIREIAEESGVIAEPVAHLGVLLTRHAQRHYFLLTKIRQNAQSDAETLEVRWVLPSEAESLLDRKRDHEVLRLARVRLKRLERLRPRDVFPMSDDD